MALPPQGGHEWLGDRRVVLDEQESGHGRNLPRSGGHSGPPGSSWKWLVLEIRRSDSRNWLYDDSKKQPNTARWRAPETPWPASMYGPNLARQPRHPRRATLRVVPR